MNNSFDINLLIILCEWSFCAGVRRFAPRPWHYSKWSFSSSQATGKVSPPNMPVILNLFRISLGGEGVI